MQIDTKELITELEGIIKDCQQKVKALAGLEVGVLNHKESADRWSAFECIEHLNLYGDYYLPEMEKSIDGARAARPGTKFSTGVLGGYFAKLMKVGKDGKMTKMKSPGDKNPANSELGIVVLDRFLKQQDKLLNLLTRARKVDLQRAKTPITLTKLVKLRLGDTFRFYVYHVERHVMQAERAVKGVEVRQGAFQVADY